VDRDRSLIVHPKYRADGDPEIRLDRWLMPPRGGAEEQFRVLATRIRRPREGNVGPGRVIAVTSALSGEGKTVNSINLAVSLARDFHHSVLLVEADFKHPMLGKVYRSRPGLGEAVAVGAPVEDCLYGTEITGLNVLLTGGDGASRSTQFLGSPTLHRIMLRLRERYDFVIVDGPPLLPVADMGLIVEWCDHVLLVVRAGQTDRSIVKQAIERLDRKKLLGVVLNAATGFTGRYGPGLTY
jgi:capsular exopolysaccharide synthesis family protein